MNRVTYIALAFVWAACGGSPRPVPMVGPAPAVHALAGEWAGEYASDVTGRSGSIAFTLRAADDSAFGDVVMIPAGIGRPLSPWRAGNTAERPHPEVLTINFVRVEAERVSGSLAPYADPQTGERLVTTFVGTLSGNTISGTFTTRLPSGDAQTGRWTVQRR